MRDVRGRKMAKPSLPMDQRHAGPRAPLGKRGRLGPEHALRAIMPHGGDCVPLARKRPLGGKASLGKFSAARGSFPRRGGASRDSGSQAQPGLPEDPAGDGKGAGLPFHEGHASKGPHIMDVAIAWKAERKGRKGLWGERGWPGAQGRRDRAKGPPSGRDRPKGGFGPKAALGSGFPQ
jgi:hypothetical protein